MSWAIASSRSAFDALFWAGVLIVVVVVSGFALMWMRRRMFSDDESDPASAASGMLEDLRRAHRAGTLSDEQFQRARDRVLRAAQGKPARDRPLHHEVTEEGVVRAKPGFDLTGRPLPAAQRGTPRLSKPSSQPPTAPAIEPPTVPDPSTPNAPSLPKPPPASDPPPELPGGSG